jgi:ribose transport system permease protein
MGKKQVNQMSENIQSVQQDRVTDKRERRRTILAFIAKYGTIIGMILMIVIFSILRPNSFFRFQNFVNIVNQASLTAIISGGLTVALIVGEMDLSIAYAASFAGVLVTGMMVDNNIPVWLSILLVMVIGAVIGYFNSLIVTKLRVNSVIATLGTGTVIVGLNFAYSQGVPIAAGVPKSFTNIALGKTGGIPNNIIIMLVVLGILWVILNRTDMGQRIQAVGGNIEAARLSGVRVDWVKSVALIITGIAAAITGILLASLIGSGTSRAADNYLLNAFAAVFLGSATLRDGEFHIVGTLIGVLIIGVGFNGLAIFGVPTFYQFVFQGAILILAVGLSSVARRFANS